MATFENVTVVHDPAVYGTERPWMARIDEIHPSEIRAFCAIGATRDMALAAARQLQERGTATHAPA